MKSQEKHSETDEADLTGDVKKNDNEPDQASRSTALIRRPSRSWEPHEDSTIRKMFSEGASPEDIGIKLGRTKGAISVRLCRLGISQRGSLHQLKRLKVRNKPEKEDVYKSYEKEMDKERLKRQKMRKCLTCTSEFLSDGPHNRMCDVCRSRSGQSSLIDAW